MQPTLTFLCNCVVIKTKDVDIFIKKAKFSVFLTQPRVFSSAFTSHSMLNVGASLVDPPARVHSGSDAGDLAWPPAPADLPETRSSLSIAYKNQWMCVAE